MATGGAHMGQIVKQFKDIQNRNETEAMIHRKDWFESVAGTNLRLWLA